VKAMNILNTKSSMRLASRYTMRFVLIALLLFMHGAWSKNNIKEFTLVLENHIFFPKEIVIPANEKVKIVIYNKDDIAEEFDSFDLNRERVIFANKKAAIYVGPLPEGKYEYFGEYHPNSARGFVIVKDDTK